MWAAWSSDFVPGKTCGHLKRSCWKLRIIQQMRKPLRFWRLKNVLNPLKDNEEASLPLCLDTVGVTPGLKICQLFVVLPFFLNYLFLQFISAAMNIIPTETNTMVVNAFSIRSFRSWGFMNDGQRLNTLKYSSFSVLETCLIAGVMASLRSISWIIYHFRWPVWCGDRFSHWNCL